MTVTVTVDATRRLVRFALEHSRPPSGWVQAYDEILVQEPATPSKGAEIFGAPAPKEGEVTYYGTMNGATVEREIGNVLAETVTVGGTTISFQTLVDASAAFFEKWRQENIENPPMLDGSTQAPEPAP